MQQSGVCAVRSEGTVQAGAAEQSQQTKKAGTNSTRL